MKSATVIGSIFALPSSRDYSFLTLLRRAILGLLLLLAPLAARADDAALNPQNKEDVVAAIGKSLEKAFAFDANFEEWPRILERHREALDAAVTPEAFAGALNAALDEFGISHLGVLAPNGARIMREQAMIGMGLTMLSVLSGLEVTEVKTDSPAAAAGLAVGDVIVELNGQELAYATQLKALDQRPLDLAWRRGDEVLTATFGDQDGAIAGLSTRPLEAGKLVLGVVVGSPADQAGIRGGDLLVEVDGTPIASAPSLRGEKGDSRTLTWRRGESIMHGTVVYDSFPLASPNSLAWLDEGIAHVVVNSFDTGLYDARALDRIFREAHAAKTIVLDLRNNPGGDLHNARRLAGYFLERNQYIGRLVLYRHARRHARDDTPPDYANDKGYGWRVRPQFHRTVPRFEGNLIVLVDSVSASGADLFPAAIQEYGRGIVIGTVTHGKLLVSRRKKLPAGFLLQYPRGEYVTYGGKRLENIGVTPDILLTIPDTATTEIILHRALEAARKQRETAS